MSYYYSLSVNFKQKNPRRGITFLKYVASRGQLPCKVSDVSHARACDVILYIFNCFERRNDESSIFM